MPVLWFLLLALPILGGAERFNCRGRILGAYYADAKSGCKAFHVCVRVAGGGVRDFRFFCPPGTLFHQEAQTCTDWGDDDPLACPADLYDGQFDVYRIGSGYDTKKVSSQGNREEEAENNLQRAETGDRRLSNNGASSSASNSASFDLRTAHSSDFFSGQRERGRDDYNPAPSSSASPPRQPSQSRQSFRRIVTPRVPSTEQYTTPTPSSPQPPQLHYDVTSKRKLVRKRPIYASTPAPSTYAQSTAQQYSASTAQQQLFSSPQPPFNLPPQSFPQQNYNQRIQQNRPTTTTALPPANVPPQYKDEYVEVPRVTPKQNKNRYYPNHPTSATFFPSPAQTPNKKEGLVELYNYDAQSTPGLSVQKENRPSKTVKNSFNVENGPREDFARTNVNNNNARITTTTGDYNTAASRGFVTSTPAYRNFNSVSYEPEKTNYVFLPDKRDFYNNPSTKASPTYTTPRPNTTKLNTVAYNTNLALNAVQSNVNNDEDDGQYRPPEGEDDGQYRPELYERELLSGAHSLNIAASGNRLPEEQQKSIEKTQTFLKQVGQTAAPRPFRPAPTPTSPPQQSTFSTETTYTTTYRAPTTFNTQRTFDYFQTYTTTSRPNSEQGSTQGSYTFAPQPPTTTPRAPEQRTHHRAPPPPSAPAPTSPPANRASPSPARPPQTPPKNPPHQNFAKPSSNKEDASYDYAYYDSDSGFSEYDHVIEEFEKTKEKRRQ